MRIIIAADIFGKTDALGDLAASLPFATEVISPYTDSELKFHDEQEGYDYFSEYVGIETYANRLLKHILESSEPVMLIGFSVGAAAVWYLAGHNNLNNVISGIGFYGSQIRHAREVEPSFPIHLVFPESEEHFCVNTLIKDVSKYQTVSVERSAYLHGFMNRRSANFNAEAYEIYLQKLKQKINEMC
ncbi:dienelactone hydrolase family protein [uncultured Pseudoteredinibacter sp.]|uniref:dienelactone hydrolase family protein n=1 Tax=uncultured Pseudoteredinibacter sp. TaxID=1641701 RepID=UPI0026038C5C|nr:dienelactone hydrolase family protein [uncultured Pseudoteredinibacter sp.]